MVSKANECIIRKIEEVNAICPPKEIYYFNENGFDFTECIIYRTVSSDLSDLKEVFYDILVFFSPADIKSLYDNFPDFIQNKTRIAGFGASTQSAISEHNLILDISAPAPGIPSMVAALEHYVSRVSSNK